MKPNTLLLMACFTFFTLGCSLIIPVWDKRFMDMKENPLETLGEEIDGDTIIEENDYGRLEITPHTSNNIIKQTQYANFTSNITDNIDVVFRFDEQINNANIWLWKNISHNVTINEYGYINSNYTLYNVYWPGLRKIKYEDINSSGGIVFGDIPSENYRRGDVTVYNDVENIFEEWINIIIGYDYYQENETGVVFDYTYWGQMGSHVEEQFYPDWFNMKHKFGYTIEYGKHDYYITDIFVEKDKSYLLKWQYNVPITNGESNGKWDLMTKLSSETIPEALISGHYVMIDPWWDTDWDTFYTITVDSDFWDETLNGFPLLVVFDNSSYSINTNNSIRFVSTDNTTEFPYEIEYWDHTGNCYVWVNISEPMVSGVDYTFLMYCNNSVATDAQDPYEVWDQNYTSVYHMNGTSILYDSTDNALHGSFGVATEPDEATGPVWKSLFFDGNDIITVGDDVAHDLAGGAEYTMEVWMKDTAHYATTSQWAINHDASLYKYMLYLLSGSTEVRFYVRTATNRVYVNTSFLYRDCFYYLAGTYNKNDDGQELKCYTNTTLDESADWYTEDITAGDEGVNIGSRTAGNNPLQNTYLDEIRISDIERNASWLKASFHSSNQSTRFLTWSNPVSPTVKPSQSGEIPVNNTRTSELNPPWGVQLYVICSGNVGDGLNATWWSNSSGTWQQFGDNESTEGFASGTNISQNNSNFSSYGTEYWFSVNLTDGYNNWNNETYNFTTRYDFTYKIFYLWHDDIPGAASTDDQGTFNTTLAPDAQYTHCGSVVTFYFNDTTTDYSSGGVVIENISAHIWFANSTLTPWQITDSNAAYNDTHDPLVTDPELNPGDNVTVNVTIDNIVTVEDYYRSDNTNYSLMVFGLPVNPDYGNLSYNDGQTTVGNFSITIKHGDGNPPLGGPNFTCSPYMQSYILVNIPDNETLNATYPDSDGDGLTDWEEIYNSYTNPFDTDTDNDGYNDNTENDTGSDPNNYSSISPKSWHQGPDPPEMGDTYAWNGSIYNTSNWISTSSWNGSLYNLSSWTFLEFWNGSVYNVSIGWNSLSTWNGSIHNSTFSWIKVDSWNGSLYNTTSWTTLSSWNGSLYNTSSWTQTSQWNGSIFNVSTIWTQVESFNGSIYNTTFAWMLIDTFNGSIYNTSSWNLISTWNLSLYNTSTWTQSSQWNASLYNTSTWQISEFWNGSLYNISVAWNLLSSWNGSIYNTTIDTIPPEVVIIFAGNPGDDGGPQHPDNHSGTFGSSYDADEGYYTNSSWQQELFINISVNVTDAEGVTSIKLHLLNESTWNNDTYTFVEFDGNWTCNVTGLGNYNYSFDVNATDASGNYNVTPWDKQVVDLTNGGYSTVSRRYVRLGGTVDNINDTVLYLHQLRYYYTQAGGANIMKDGFEHDQGTNSGAGTDTGVWNSTEPADDSTEDLIYCGGYVGAWFDEEITINKTQITKIYLHIWANTTDGILDEVGFGGPVRDTFAAPDIDQFYASTIENARSNVSAYIEDTADQQPYFINGTYNFFLETHLYELTTPVDITDNSLYQYLIGIDDGVPKMLSNRSIASFVIINPSNNATLNTWDNDSDGLNNFEEMFFTFTNPYEEDTDNDGYNDAIENSSGSDPNNYSSIPLRGWNSMETWNGSIYNTSSWNLIEFWNGSLYNLISWTNIEAWSGSLFNTSAFQNIESWSGSLYNSTTWISEESWSGSLYNETHWTYLEAWNGSLFNTTEWILIETWNGSLYNTTSWTDIESWNGSLYNLTFNWIQIKGWSGSIYNLSAYWNSIESYNCSLYNLTTWQNQETWNGSLYNISSWQTLESWNGSLYNTSIVQWISTESWSGSLFNTSAFQNVEAWSGSLYNSTNWQNQETWNGSLCNVTNWDSIEIWRGSLFNLTNWFSIESWNGSLYNFTNWILVESWNGSLYNETFSWIQTEQWNGSLYNDDTRGWSSIGIYSWNGSLHNTSLYWTSIESYDGSLYNSSFYWTSIDSWNGSLCNSSAWVFSETWNGSVYNDDFGGWSSTNIWDWNGSLYNLTDWNFIEPWNGSIYNTSAFWTSIETWNGSIYNSTTGTWQSSSSLSWNGSIYNTSVIWQSVEFFNGSLFNSTSSWIFLDTWNGSLYNLTSWNSLESWNGSLFNVSFSWQTVESWNGSLYNTSVFQDVESWNGSLFNISSHWTSSSAWNGSLYNLSAWIATENWNGSLFNISVVEWTSIESWSGSLYNSSNWISSEGWNGSIFNISAIEWTFVESWNGSIFNVSREWRDDETWNGSIVHTDLDVDFNCSVNGATISCSASTVGYATHYMFNWSNSDNSLSGSTGWLAIEDVIENSNSFACECNYDITVFVRNDFNESAQITKNYQSAYEIPPVDPTVPDPITPIPDRTYPDAGEERDDRIGRGYWIFDARIVIGIMFVVFVTFVILRYRKSKKKLPPGWEYEKEG